MESIYDRYGLPPRPPRTSLSHRWSPESMRLPEFRSVAEARTFVNHLAVFHSDPALNATRLVFASLTAVFCLVSVARQALFFHQRRAWLFRLIRSPRGTIIVPCVNSIFCLISLKYAVVNTIFSFVEIVAVKRGEPVPCLPLWIVLQFTPLLFALFWQSWASVFVRLPGSHRYELGFRPRAGHYQLHPHALNALWLCVPFVACTICAIPAFEANDYYTQFKRQRLVWLAEYAAQTELSSDLLIGVQEVWSQMRMSVYYLAVAINIGGLCATGVTVIYAVISIRLHVYLRQHLSALLHIKQARELVGGVRLDQCRIIAVSAPEEDEPPLARDSSQRPYREVVDEDVFGIESTRSCFFPPVAPNFARFEPLGDGSGFRLVLRLYGIQLAVLIAGSASVAIMGLFLGNVIVDRIERNSLEGLENAFFLFLQIWTWAFAMMIIVTTWRLNRSESFLALMHGNFYADGLNNAAVGPSASAAALPFCSSPSPSPQGQVQRKITSESDAGERSRGTSTPCSLSSTTHCPMPTTSTAFQVLPTFPRRASLFLKDRPLHPPSSADIALDTITGRSSGQDGGIDNRRGHRPATS
ncbi:hypothetical protein V8E36_005100 [Tilletia maclaganii]